MQYLLKCGFQHEKYHLTKGCTFLLVTEFSGFSDPTYDEAYVTLNRYDIVLIASLVNITKETLQNLYLELATMGDLKLDTLAPGTGIH